MSAVQVLIRTVALTGILGSIAGALTLLQPESDSRRYGWWSLAVLVFVAVDLGRAAWGLNPTVPAAFYDRIVYADRADERGYWPEEAERAVVFDTYLLFDDYRVAVENWRAFRASEVPNLNLLDRWSLLNNFDPLRVGHFEAYLDVIEQKLPDADALLQAANVGAVYNADGNRETLDHETARAWFVESACWHEDEASLVGTISDSGWDPMQQVHLMGEGECP